MKLNKMLTTGLAVVASLLLTACGGETTQENQVLTSIEEKGKVVIAMNPEFPPFEFRTLIDGKDTIVGADVELAKAIADELGVEVEFSSMSFNNVLTSLQLGKADLAISGISATEERAKLYDFSVPYYQSVNKIIIRKADLATYATSESFESATIGTQKGTIQEEVAKAQFTTASFISLEQNGELINELKSGHLDGVVFEEPIAKAYVANNDDLVIADIAIETSISDSYAVAMNKNNPALKEKVDKVITELVESGKMAKMVEDAYQLSISGSSE